jgi:hypothetical protein
MAALWLGHEPGRARPDKDLATGDHPTWVAGASWAAKRAAA